MGVFCRKRLAVKRKSKERATFVRSFLFSKDSCKGLRKKTKQEAKEDCFLEKQSEQEKGFQTGEEGKT